MANRLMQRLREIMPKRPDPPPTGKAMLQQPRHESIRLAADSFAHWLGEDWQPQDLDELRAILWVFGEITSGAMERQVNAALKVACDATALSLPKPFSIKPPEEAGS
jgi:hypothetical protein